MPAILCVCAPLVGAIEAATARGQDSSADPAKSTPPPLPTLNDALAAKRDVWGDASVRQPGGPSYDFFAKLLPPLRYVNTNFRHYPIVLSRPDGAIKARYVSNGSGVNLLAGTDTWWDRGRVPVAFFVGDENEGTNGSEPFGEEVERLTGPKWLEGWLPVVENVYRYGATSLRQEAFASIAAPIDPDDACVFVRFSIDKGPAVQITARVGTGTGMRSLGQFIADGDRRAFVWFVRHQWKWNDARQQLVATVTPEQPVELAIFTRGVVRPSPGDVGIAGPPLRSATYDEQRDQCTAHWRRVIDGSTAIHTGEPRVDDAYKAVLVGTLLLAQGDTLMYSAGNLYETTFEAECGDAVRALLLCGVPDAARFVAPLLARPLQSGIEISDVAYKLHLLAHAHQLTRDAGRTREWLALVQKDVAWALGQIEPASGLAPPQAYCGDVAARVDNLQANAALWQGLRDPSIVEGELGDASASAQHASAAASLRDHLLAAVAKSERNDVTPPFLPIALFGAEAPYDPLTATKQGAYWNLLAPFVAATHVFGGDSPRTRALIDYAREHGGLCMGMVRFDQHSGLFANEKGLDDLYSLRLVDELLRRDEPDRALVAFYGKLAQGMTPDTCVGCEGSSLVPLDAKGRPMYLPPNGAANAFFLWTLRGLFVQELDADDDGHPETLRLLFATPPTWLADGNTLSIERAPTTFGDVSVKVTSTPIRGRVRVEIQSPPHSARRMQLRLRLPDEWVCERARIADEMLDTISDGEFDLTGRGGSISIDVDVTARERRR